MERLTNMEGSDFVGNAAAAALRSFVITCLSCRAYISSINRNSIYLNKMEFLEKFSRRFTLSVRTIAFCGALLELY